MLQNSLKIGHLVVAILLCVDIPCQGSQVTLTISPETGTNNLNIAYSFSKPVNELSFETEGRSIRAFWTPITKGVELRGELAVSIQGNVDEMRFMIRPDDVQFDRVNPGMYALGDGVVVNLGYLVPDPSKFHTALFVAAPDKVLVTDHLFVEIDAQPEKVSERTGFAYIGPGEAIEQRQNVVVVAPITVNAPIVDLFVDVFSTAADFYANFAQPPSQPPRIFLAFKDMDVAGNYYRGTVIDNALAVYLKGNDWLKSEIDSGQRHTTIARFIRHETFHFFQGSRFSAIDDRHSSAWLTEGTAEYFANRLTHTEDNTAQITFEDIAMDCVMELIDEPLVQDGIGQKGKAPYVCGRYLIEATSLMSKSPDEAIQSIWEAMLHPESTHGILWTTEEFFSVAEDLGVAEHLEDLASLVIHSSGIERWNSATQLLRKFIPDIDISIPLEIIQASEAIDLVFQLVTSYCDGRGGFWNHGDYIILDAPDCSGGLVDKAEIAIVESHPFGEPTKWLDPFKERCANGESIRFGLRNGSTLEVECVP